MASPKFSSLRTSLWLLVLLSVVPAFALISYQAQQNRNNAVKAARAGVERIAKDAADEFRILIGLSQQLLISLSQTPELQLPGTNQKANLAKTNNEDSCDSLLAKLIKLHARYLNIGVIAMDGTVVCSALSYDRSTNLADRFYFRQATASRKFTIGEYQIGRITGKASVNVAYPMIDGQDKIAAVLFIAIDLEWMGDVLSQHRNADLASLFLVDRSGAVLGLHPRNKRWIGKTLTGSPLGKVLFAQNASGGVEAVGLDGVLGYFGFAPMLPEDPASGFVIAGIKKAPIIEQVNRAFANHIISIVGVALLVLALGWWGAGVLVLQRVKKLAGVAERLGTGDLGVRTDLASDRDELGALARSFDSMADNLQVKTKELQRTNRALHTLSAGNRTLLHAKDEQALLREMCRVVVEKGGYRGAWVGFAEHDEDKTVRIVAHHGVDDLFVARVRVSWGDTDIGRGPTGTTIVTGKPTVVQDMLTDPRIAPWREEVARPGYASAISLPLRIDDGIIGVITIYSAELAEFGDAEIHLLTEMADDLAFGIATLRQREDARRTEKRFADLYELSPDALVTTDHEGVINMINRQAEAIFGWSRTDLVGQKIEVLVPEKLRQAHPELRKGFMQLPTLRAMGTRSANLQAARKDGTLFPVEISLSPMELGAGLMVVVAAVRDVTERRNAEETIRRLAYCEPLTGLANRIRLCEHLEQAIAAASTQNRPLALLSLNIGRFRDFQDGLGFKRAEKLLLQIANRFQKVVTGNDVLACLDEDKFAILLPQGDASYAQQVAHKVREAMQEPFMVDDVVLDVQANIGAAFYPGHGTEPDALILRSDIAAREARLAGNEYGVYAGITDQESPQRLVMISKLRHAINSDELILYYQPKVDTLSGRVCGAEALVRWQHPEHGMIPPVRFIPLAEHTGLIKPLTYWVLNATMRQCVAWQKIGLELPVAVNLSVDNLRDPELLNMIKGSFATWGLPPERLQMEITESTLMENPKKSLEVLNHLKDMGIQLFIDDFGTGYSSLGYLATLPVHALKIDRSFIIKMVNEPDHMAIVSSTISLAHSLKLKVVAEGVDAEEQAQVLRLLRCDEIQGYLYSPPLAPEKFQEWQAKFTMNAGKPEG